MGVVGLLELSRAPLLLRLLLSYGLGALLSAHALLAVGRPGSALGEGGGGGGGSGR